VAGGTPNPIAAKLAEAHRALRADMSVQFDLKRAVPPPPPPAWLGSVGRFLRRIFGPIARGLNWLFSFIPGGPWATVLLYGILAMLAGALVWMVAVRLKEGAWRWPRRRRATQLAVDAEPEEDWRPDAAPARALLREADALAGEGRFAEAVHLLLLRGVEDITRRRPVLNRPALTSRDLAAADTIPARPRLLFAGIARLVERSLFGGRALGAGEWGEARAAYADFALPRAWSAPQ